MSDECRHIIVVDDEKSFRLTMKLILSVQNHKVTEASNGMQALEILRKLKDSAALPDLLFTDLKMPVMDGLELIDTLRQEEIEMSVVVATSYNDREISKELANRGCLHVLEKPFEAWELLQLLQEIFAEQ